MPPWTKQRAIQRFRRNARLKQILNIEPRLREILTHALLQKHNRRYNRILTYIRLRNKAIPLVGRQAEQESLRSSNDYLLVITTIMDLLPPDNSDFASGKHIKPDT